MCFLPMTFATGQNIAWNTTMIDVRVKAAKFDAYNNVFNDISFYTSIGGPMLHEVVDICYFDTYQFILKFDVADAFKCSDLNSRTHSSSKSSLPSDYHFLIRSYNRFGLSVYILTNLCVYYRVFFELQNDVTECDLSVLDMGKCIDYKMDIDNIIKAFMSTI